VTLRSLSIIQKALDLQSQLNEADSLYNILKELQGLKVSVVAGTTANTDITVSGISTSDTILAVLELVGAGVDVTDIQDETGNASITAANTIQISTDTSGSKLIVLWYDKEY